MQLLADDFACVLRQKGKLTALNSYTNLSSGCEGAQLGTDFGSGRYWTLAPEGRAVGTIQMTNLYLIVNTIQENNFISRFRK